MCQYNTQHPLQRFQLNVKTNFMLTQFFSKQNADTAGYVLRNEDLPEHIKTEKHTLDFSQVYLDKNVPVAVWKSLYNLRMRKHANITSCF